VGLLKIRFNYLDGQFRGGVPMGDAVRESLRRLRAGGRRVTVQRRAVLLALAALGCAPEVRQVYARARRIYRRLGVVTVYRTLQALADEGLIQPVVLDDGRLRYELRDDRGHHHHLVCLSCGSIARLAGCALSPLRRAGSRRGFAVTAHRLELLGYCGRCRRSSPRNAPHS